MYAAHGIGGLYNQEEHIAPYIVDAEVALLVVIPTEEHIAPYVVDAEVALLVVIPTEDHIAPYILDAEVALLVVIPTEEHIVPYINDVENGSAGCFPLHLSCSTGATQDQRNPCNKNA